MYLIIYEEPKLYTQGLKYLHRIKKRRMDIYKSCGTNEFEDIAMIIDL